MRSRFLRNSRLILLSLLPAVLFGQGLTQLGALEYRTRPETVQRVRKPQTFVRGIPAPVPYRLGGLRQQELDAVLRDPRLSFMGVERSVETIAPIHGEWLTLDQNQTVWRAAIQSDGAAGIRLLLSGFSVGNGAVWIYTPDRAQVFGPYTGTGPDESGEFWSNAVFADTVVVEYQPQEPTDVVSFTVSRVAHLVSAQQAMSAGTCELDVSCYSDWAAMASGVGMYIFQKGGASYACSGALLNNSKNDSKPYFLTANHCISDAASARTVQVYWNYQTSKCNGTAPSLSSLPTSLGATYLVSAPIPSGDFSLLLLSQLPNANLTFYGWNASSTALPAGAAATGIHHPQADYTRVAFGVRDPDMAAQVGTDLAPAADYYQIRETSGRIEPGSSGSPLFNSSKVIVGTLTYGPGGDACSTSPFSAGYGRFSVAYPSMSSYLSPTASGNTNGSGSTTGPAAGVTVSATPTSVKTPWTIYGSSPAAQSIQLSTTTSTAVAITATASQPWIALSPASFSLVQGKPITLAVTLNTQTFTAAGAYTGTITLTGSGVSQSIPVEVDVTAATSAVKGGPVSVIPLFVDGSGSKTTFTLLNPYATATSASISFVAANGTALSVGTGQAQAASWQNLTIPAFGTATVTTAGTSSPQKQGLALVQSGDVGKKVQVLAQVNLDLIAASVSATPPLVFPFDATSTATTTLYLYNPATSGSVTLALTVYDTTGKLVGTGQIAIPAQQQGAIAMSKTAAVFGGNKGTLSLSGTAAVLGMGIRTGSDGRMNAVAPVEISAR